MLVSWYLLWDPGWPQTQSNPPVSFPKHCVRDVCQHAHLECVSGLCFPRHKGHVLPYLNIHSNFCAVKTCMPSGLCCRLSGSKNLRQKLDSWMPMWRLPHISPGSEMNEPGLSSLVLCSQNTQAWASCALTPRPGTRAHEDLVTARLILVEKRAGAWPQALCKPSAMW